MASMQVEKAKKVVVDAEMSNPTPKVMRCVRYHSYDNENPSVGVLSSIPAGGMPELIEGLVSKGFAEWEGFNNDADRCAWILAWDAHASPKKVYVTCGAKDKIDQETPDEILRHLNKSKHSSTATDPGTKTTSGAKIAPLPGGSANLVGACFGLVPLN